MCSDKMTDPIKNFKKRIKDFALKKKKGIRNPFVIVTVEPPLEHKAARELELWAKTAENEMKINCIWMDTLFPQTEVFQIINEIPIELTSLEAVEQTLKDNLTEDIVDLIEEKYSLDSRSNVLLLLSVGSLFPFAKASGVLDELARRRAKNTVGVLFPGEPMAGRLSLYGERPKHYYPAHTIDKKIEEGML